MIRLLIAASTCADAAPLLGRARAALRLIDDDVEIVLVVDDAPSVRRWTALAAPEARIVAVHPSVPADGRLDAGVYLRPLPEQVIVVGRASTCSPAEMSFLSMLLGFRAGLAGVTTDGDLGPDVEPILRHGAAFAAGALCVAGGFSGDGRTSVHDRLERVGAESVVLPPARIDGAEHVVRELRAVPA